MTDTNRHDIPKIDDLHPTNILKVFSSHCYRLLAPSALVLFCLSFSIFIHISGEARNVAHVKIFIRDIESSEVAQDYNPQRRRREARMFYLTVVIFLLFVYNLTCLRSDNPSRLSSARDELMIARRRPAHAESREKRASQHLRCAG